MFAMDEASEKQTETLGAFLKQVMQERDLSITALARGAGLSTQSLHVYLNGARPNLESCRKLSFFLGVALSKIIGLVHPDVEEKRLESLIELYLELPEEEKMLLEDFAMLLTKH